MGYVQKLSELNAVLLEGKKKVALRIIRIKVSYLSCINDGNITDQCEVQHGQAPSTCASRGILDLANHSRTSRRIDRWKDIEYSQGV